MTADPKTTERWSNCRDEQCRSKQRCQAPPFPCSSPKSATSKTTKAAGGADWMWCYENPHDAAAEIERLRAALAERIFGTITDATPVSDLHEELRELKIEMAEIKKRMRTISNMCNAPYWNADRRWKVRDIAEGKAR